MVKQAVTYMDKIGNDVQQCLTRWIGDGAVLDAAGCTLAERAFSFLLRFPIKRQDEEDTAVYIRIARYPQNITLEQAIQPNTEAAERTQKYFDNAAAIARAFADTPFGFIRPLAHWPQYNAVVTEEYPSQSLRQLFNQPAMILGQKQADRQLQNYLEQAGEWLNRYHQRVGRPIMQSMSPSTIRQETAAELAKLNPYLINQKFTAWLAAQLENLSDTAANEAMLWGQPHGDFHFANILVQANGRIAVIDANASAKSRPVYADLAKLIVDPLTITRQWLTVGLLLPKRKAVRLANAVMRGYFGESQPPREIMKFYMLLAIIQKWTYIEKKSEAASSLPALAKRVLAVVRRRYFTNLCQKVVSL